MKENSESDDPRLIPEKWINGRWQILKPPLCLVDDESDVSRNEGESEKPSLCAKCSALAGFPVSHTGRQLVHTAYEMFLTREAKYNDPHNEEWDWEDVTDKWERHAFSAFRDLISAESMIDRLIEERRKARQLFNLANPDLPDFHANLKRLIENLKPASFQDSER